MYLLDTDIIIYSLKGESKVVSNFNLYKQAPKALSVITYGELIYGAKRSKNKISNLAKKHSQRNVSNYKYFACHNGDIWRNKSLTLFKRQRLG